MAPRIHAGRCAALAVALACVLPGAPALAQSGNGLYEPFPEAAVKKRAERYVERLSDRTPGGGRAPTAEQLAAGVFVRARPGDPAPASPAPQSGPGAATTRAGAGGTGADLALPVQLLMVAAALLLPAAALMRRGRVRAA